MSPRDRIFPDGVLIAAAGKSQTIHLWDVATREELMILQRGHQQQINGLTFAPDGMAARPRAATMGLSNSGTLSQQQSTEIGRIAEAAAAFGFNPPDNNFSHQLHSKTRH